MFNVIVVGADDSPTARRAVEAATELAVLYGSQLHIISAFERQSVRNSALPAEFRNLNNDGEVEALLQVLSFIPKSRGIDATVHAVAGDPAEAIASTAEALGADLIVVGNKGMKGVRRVLGSVPNTIAHSSPCSVIIVDTTE